MKQNYFNCKQEKSMSELINSWQRGNNEYDLDREMVYHRINDYLRCFDLDKSKLMTISSSEIINRVKCQDQIRTFLDLLSFLSSMERNISYLRLKRDMLANINQENVLSCNYY